MNKILSLAIPETEELDGEILNNEVGDTATTDTTTVQNSIE